MSYILTNLTAILIATVVGLLVTVLVNRRAGVGALIVVALAQFWLCAILAGGLILAPRAAGLWVMTIGTAVIIWIGFVLPVLVGNGRLHGVKWSTIGTDVAHWLAVMIAQAVVLRLVGVVAP